MAKAVKITKNLKNPEKPGLYRRIICLSGNNKGLCYYLNGPRVVFGRSDTTDIQVLDPKASREHLELVLVKGQYILTDLKSQNGVIVNDLKVSRHKLEDGDKIIIGKTVFKFGSFEVKNELVEYEEDVEDDDDEEEELDSNDATKKKAPNKRVIIYGAVGLLLVFFLLPTDKDNAPKPEKPVTASETIIIDDGASNKESIDDKELKSKLNAIIHRGQREYREGNYFRAMEEFRMALILSPEHGEASFYMRKSKQRIDEVIASLFVKATQDTEALKYSAAVVSYCSVIKLLNDFNKEDERYKQAKNQLRDVESRMGLDEGEVKCFEAE